MNGMNWCDMRKQPSHLFLVKSGLTIWRRSVAEIWFTLRAIVVKIEKIYIRSFELIFLLKSFRSFRSLRECRDWFKYVQKVRVTYLNYQLTRIAYNYSVFHGVPCCITRRRISKSAPVIENVRLYVMPFKRIWNAVWRILKARHSDGDEQALKTVLKAVWVDFKSRFGCLLNDIFCYRYHTINK